MIGGEVLAATENVQLVFGLWPEFAVDLETLLIRASTASLILTVLAAVDPVIDFIERHVERA